MQVSYRNGKIFDHRAFSLKNSKKFFTRLLSDLLWSCKKINMIFIRLLNALKKCLLNFRLYYNATPTNATICDGTDWKGAIAHGDRGTPLIIANNGTWFQTGIFSAPWYNTSVYEALAQRELISNLLLLLY
jgi:hypothetical protein